MNFKDWALSHGISNPILDGKRHRYKTKEDKGKEESGFYQGGQSIFPDGKERITCTVKDWRRPDWYDYFPPKNGTPWSDDEKRFYEAEWKKQNEEAEKEQAARYEEGKKRANELWNNAKPGNAQHPYLIRKKVGCHGLRLDDIERLVIPVLGEKGEITGAQTIDGDGKKKFTFGTKKLGAFFKIPGDGTGPIALCEGYATAATIFEATGFDTFVAFDCGNIGPVIQTIKRAFRSRPIVIFADDDKHTKDNPGRTKAELAAEEIGVTALFPVFPKEDMESSDWNDLWVRYGEEEVKKQIKEWESCKSDTANRLSVGAVTPNNAESGGGRGSDKIPQELSEPFKKLSQKKKEELVKEILDCRFKLFIDEQTSILYNIKDIDKKELIVCQNDELLLRRLKQNIFEKTGSSIKENEVKDLYGVWRLTCEPLKERPASFSWKDEDKWALKKLDFVPCEGPYDSWKEFLFRMSAPDDFMAFIWSVFEEKSRSRQYLYIYDPHGQGGKTTVINVIGEVFGNSYTAINNSFVSGPAARWLLSNLYGKRLVGWPDVKNTKFCMSESLRNITSGDGVSIEFKGQSPFFTTMYLKLIMASNHEPSITSGGADASRLIRINLEENRMSKNDPEWRDRLKKEMPHFLFECRKWYFEKCKNHGDIKLGAKTMELTDESTDGIESKFEDIIHRRIQFGSAEETSVSQWVEFYKDEKLTDYEVGNLKDYLKRISPGVKIKRPWIDGKRVTVYLGFKIKDRGIF